jgi:hypothetical protein
VAAWCGAPDTGRSGRLNRAVLDGFWDFENGPNLNICNSKTVQNLGALKLIKLLRELPATTFIIGASLDSEWFERYTASKFKEKHILTKLSQTEV